MSELKTEKTFEIPECNKEKFEKKIAFLNRKAEKLGCKKIEFTSEAFMKERTEQVYNSKKHKFEFVGTGEFDRYYRVQVSGEAPSFQGWNFLAKLEPTAHGNLIKGISSVDLPKEYRKADLSCDHCKTSRNRKFTFVVEKEGEYRKVGKTCLKDFLGHKDPNAIARWCEIVLELDFSDFSTPIGGEVQETYYSLQTVCAYAASAIDKHGFHSSQSETPTKGIVYTCLAPAYSDTAKAYKKEMIEKYRPSEQDEITAKNTLDWIAGFETQELSDYQHNLLMIYKHEAACNRDFGILVSAVYVYLKEQDKLKAYEKVEKSNEHIGVIGERDNYKLKLVGSKEIYESYDDSEYYIHRFEDEKGNCFVWFTGKDIKVDKEDVHEYRATVKRHDEFNGRKQTVLTRVSACKK